MKHTSILQMLPESVRSTLYVAIAFAGLVLGSIAAYTGAVGSQPDWLTGALAAYGFLAGAFGFTAAANVNGTKPVGEKFTGTDADLLFTTDEDLLAGPEPGETTDGDPLPVDEDDAEPGNGRRIKTED